VAKWIRWQGVVAFVILGGLLAAVWWLVVDRVVKSMIEQTGTAVIGAKVELEAADVTLLPLGLTLSHLQITNPDEPMTNAVEIARIAAAVDALNLLRRKIIMEGMTVEGLRLNTPRQTSGAVAERPDHKEAPEKGGEGISLPTVELKDPKAILDQELAGLKSLKLVEGLQADLHADKAKWRQRIAELPDKAAFTEYKKRIESLKSSTKGGLGGVLGGLEEVQKIQADLKRDIDRITGAKQELEQTVASFKQRAAEVAKAPQEDVARLLDKYGISGQGLANITRALFAGPLTEYVETVLRWHRRLEPLLNRPAEKKAEVEVVKPVRGAGVDVRFREQAPLPDLLIKKAIVSVELSAGTIHGRIDNITPDQQILGAPMTFAFAGQKLKDLDSIALDGAVNRVNPMKPADNATLRVTAFRLNHLGLGGDGVPLSLKQGVADLDIRAVLAGSELNATIGSRVRSVQIVGGEKLASGPAGQAIAGALAAVKAFQVKATVAGTQEHYDVTLASDIDEVLKGAVGKQAAAQAAKLGTQLRSAIDEKVSAQLQDIHKNLGGFDPLVQELVSRLNVGQDVSKLGAGGLGGKSGFQLPF
jgi:uncharacterized protein (TIGR03545 family)